MRGPRNCPRPAAGSSVSMMCCERGLAVSPFRFAGATTADLSAVADGDRYRSALQNAGYINAQRSRRLQTCGPKPRPAAAGHRAVFISDGQIAPVELIARSVVAGDPPHGRTLRCCGQGFEIAERLQLTGISGKAFAEPSNQRTRARSSSCAAAIMANPNDCQFLLAARRGTPLLMTATPTFR